MKDELKQLRKTAAAKPISKMKKSDIAVELEKLRGAREQTPAVVATKSSPSKSMVPKIADVKVAKEKEFPVAPAAPKKAMKGKKEVSPVPSRGSSVEPKMSKNDMLKKLIEEMED